MQITAIVLAAGRGERMGADKALLGLAGRPAIEHAVEAVSRGGATRVIVVRRRGAAPLPAAVAHATTLVEVEPDHEMIDSLRAGVAASAGADVIVVLPVDHALAGAEATALVLAQVVSGRAPIGVPLFDDHAGHPVALAAAVLPELDHVPTLRELLRADPSRVAAVPVTSPWVRRDLDTPDDLAAARAALRGPAQPVLALMHTHRSRRAFRPDPVPDDLIEALVDAARHASTSSFIQASSLVVVTDPDRKAEVARLCGDQRHIHEAPVFVAVCADLHRIAVACERHGANADTDTLEGFVEATVDAALVGQNLLLGAEACGLGGCMIGAARNHPVDLARTLALPPHAYVVFGLVLGHPADDPIPRGRMPLSGVLHWQRYDRGAAAAAIDAADEAMRAWARRTNAEGRTLRGRAIDEQRGWSDRMTKLWCDGPGYGERDHLLARLRALGFGLEPAGMGGTEQDS